MTELERELIALGRMLDVPVAPDLAPAVLAAIEPRRRMRGGRRLVLVLAAVLATALLATLAIPDARSALLRFLQIGGVRIELVDELPVVVPNPPELELILGRRVSLADARRRAPFELLELATRPDRVYLGDRGTVWFLYGSPDAVRLLLAQTPELRVAEPFLLLKKLATAGTRVERATVRGAPAYFLSGEPHVVLLVGEDGVTHPESARLARDVLVWEEGGRTVRIEGDLTRREAVEIADSLR